MARKPPTPKGADPRRDDQPQGRATISRPFAPPETGKIAVKVINHYGDEVLKVYDVGV